MTTQELQFELMKKGSFNGFDGEEVVRFFQDNPVLWQGVIFDRGSSNAMNGHPFAECIDLIRLRDIPDDCWNADTLYITPKKGREADLKERIEEKLGADEVDWMDPKGTLGLLGPFSPNPLTAVLRVWWD